MLVFVVLALQFEDVGPQSHHRDLHQQRITPSMDPDLLPVLLPAKVTFQSQQLKEESLESIQRPSQTLTKSLNVLPRTEPGLR